MRFTEALSQITTLPEQPRELLARFQSAEIAARRSERNPTHFNRLNESLATNDIALPYRYGEAVENYKPDKGFGRAGGQGRPPAWISPR